MPPFQPPKPKVSDGLKTLLKIGQTTFLAPKFQASLKKAFVDCCIAPERESESEVEYKIYRGHKHGSMNKINMFQGPCTDPELGNLGVVVEAIDATTIVTRNDAEDAALSDEDGEDDDEDDEDDDGCEEGRAD